MVSGQGYLQLGVVLGLGPAVLLLVTPRPGLGPVWREFLLACVLALLLAGLFWVPLAHFWPNFGKAIDPYFTSMQPVGLTPLNLVINDAATYRSEALGKQPYPYLYVNYVGWVPILLALCALRLIPRRRRRLLAFFVVAIGGVYLASSEILWRAIGWIAPDFASGVRNPPLIAGLAVPLVIGLAAYGLDLLLQYCWGRRSRAGWAAARRWLSLLLLPPLLWSLHSAYTFNQQWLGTVERDRSMEAVFATLASEGSTWVEVPYGHHVWVPPALDAGLKLTNVVRPWHWKDRELPEPARTASFSRDHGEDAPHRQQIGNIHVARYERPHYAAVIGEGGWTVPCRAEARGGNIDVSCETAMPGLLIVRENAWSGWYAWRGGVAIDLHEANWLMVDAPPGAHRYHFRYRPWDVWLGGLLTLGGVLLAVWLWLRAPAAPPAMAPRTEPPA